MRHERPRRIHPGRGARPVGGMVLAPLLESGDSSPDSKRGPALSQMKSADLLRRLGKDPVRRTESEGRSPKNGVRRTESEERSPKDGVRIPNGLEFWSPKDPPHRESGISKVPSPSFTDSQARPAPQMGAERKEEREASSPTRTQTLNLAVNSRSLYRLSYRGIHPLSILGQAAQLKWTRPAERMSRGAWLARDPSRGRDGRKTAAAPLAR